MPKNKGREYAPYGWSRCEASHPKVQKKLKSCIKKVEKKQCPRRFKSYKECTVNPVAVCRNAIKCPP